MAACDEVFGTRAESSRTGTTPLTEQHDKDRLPTIAAWGLDVIFFRVIDAAVRIERVLHGARNLPAVRTDNMGADD